MRSIGRIGFVALGLLALACSEGNLGDGANGGHGGAGGSSAGGTSAGGGAGGRTDLVLPDCVQALIASCPPSGTCVSQKTDGGAKSELCFASGVHATSTTLDDQNGCSGVTVVTVTKADGSPCYSIESNLEGVCEGTRYVWKDAAGQVVATGSANGYSSPTTTITCTAINDTTSCNAPSGANGGKGDPCCGVSVVGTPICNFPDPSCSVGPCPGSVGGSGGRGGSGGSGGSGSGGGRGGTGGSVDLKLPDCVQALVASCQPGGTCVSELTDGAAWSQLCFSSGVRATTEGDFVGSGGSKVISVSKADGTPCYSFQTTLIGGELYQYVWKDAAGQVVATGSEGPFSTPTAQLTCAVGGQTTTCNGSIVNPTGACCSVSLLGNTTCGGTPACTTGRCP
jgi:hypothetical protein